MCPWVNAKQATDYPETVFTTLAHHMDIDFLKETHRRNNKKSAPGVDGVTATQYTKNLDENLQELHNRLRKGLYKAPPVQRVWIDKENGQKRPIGKPTYEDKIVQRAVEMLLSAIYETLFHDFSYGFRKGRSQHQAIHELREKCFETRVNRIISADITGLFDNIDHRHLLEIIKQKVNDGSLLRLIGKWLNAGVMEQGTLTYPESGTPQGGSISPVLSNIFLHQVLDEWFVGQVKPRMKGRCFLIRWADDFIIGCEYAKDADRLMQVLPKRFNRFGLTVHPEKTVVIPFKRPPLNSKKAKTGTFDFLGFSFYWAKSHRGNWVIKKKTSKKRQARFMKGVWQWCKTKRHKPLREQQATLSAKLRGFYQYFGVTGNCEAINAVFRHVERTWRYWLSRRSHKGYISGPKFNKIRAVYPLPKPRILHSL